MVIAVDPAAGALSPQVTRAAALLRAGGVVAFPTETVYGLGADAHNAAAVARIFSVKGRPADNPLIVHVLDLAAVEPDVAAVTPLARRLAAAWWPGPLTLVLPRRSTGRRLADGVTAGLDTVAVRAPAHPVARALLSASGLALAAPSANRSGRPSPTTATHVRDDLDEAVDLILDGGQCTVGLESTVVDARGERPVVLREGAISREDLGTEDDTGGIGEGDRIRSPGTRHRHYAPRCTVEMHSPEAIVRRARELAAAGCVVGAVAPTATDIGPALPIAAFASVAELGQQLFSALRRAEDHGCDVVLVSTVDERGVGRAVMDRLRRAATA